MPKPTVEVADKKKITKSTGSTRPPVRKVDIRYPTHVGKVGWCDAEQARKLLLWMQSPNASQPYTDYLFKDINGVPTVCLNVEKQRPFYAATAKQYMSEILGWHWNGDGGEANGQAIVIGKYASVIEGKHRLIGLVWAEQEWLKHPDKYPKWKESPKIHTFINFGVREDVISINTLDCGKPRSLADAVYASGLFVRSETNRSKMKQLCRMLDYAIRLLWSRTGASEDAFAPKRTHAESLDFIQRHPRILACVKHIYEENGKDDKLKSYPSPGYAAALLYLMGSAKTVRENDEGTGYTQTACPTEDLLDWSLWDKACMFFTDLADATNPKLNYLRSEVAELLDQDGSSFREERTALIIKSFWQYAHDEPVNRKTIALELVKNQDGRTTLAETPLCGEVFGDCCGIDIGPQVVR